MKKFKRHRNFRLIFCAFGFHDYRVKTKRHGMVTVWSGEFECEQCKDLAPFTAKDLVQGFAEITAEYLVKQVLKEFGMFKGKSAQK